MRQLTTLNYFFSKRLKQCYYLCTVMMLYRHILVTTLLAFSLLQTKAQEITHSDIDPEQIHLLPNVFPTVVINGERMVSIWLPEFVKFAPLHFRNAQEVIDHQRLVRDVRRTLPYAILISQMIMETYRMLEMLPDDRARQQHLNQMDRYLRREYTPRMQQLTRRQGEILMLLIDRETGTSSFHIIQATMGRVQALAANTLARLWGNNLRTRFDPHNNAEHRMIERIAIEIEMGVI